LIILPFPTACLEDGDFSIPFLGGGPSSITLLWGGFITITISFYLDAPQVATEQTGG